MAKGEEPVSPEPWRTSPSAAPVITLVFHQRSHQQPADDIINPRGREDVHVEAGQSERGGRGGGGALVR